MTHDEFLSALQSEAATFTSAIATNKGDWIIKGFIDIYRRIYTISVDTKVISKVLELLLLPAFERFAERYNLLLELSSQQNFYPDLTFTHSESGRKFAVDIKSTYRMNDSRVNGMTLGAFTGYFRNRDSNKNILYPYNFYSGHFVLGVIYSKNEGIIDERKLYDLEDIKHIESVIKNFIFFAQPKYCIASSKPGSGNTKNIGSVIEIDKLLNGNGPFSLLGEKVYDDYWMYYLTNDMAKTLDLKRPYVNLKDYLEYKDRGSEILKAHEEEIKIYS